MQTTQPSTLTQQADGVIQRLDPVNREMQVRINGDSMTFDISQDCAVVLNRERVKIRLLQPADRVRVFYHTGPDGLRTANRIVATAGLPGNV